MKTKTRYSGLTLTEMVVVVSIVAAFTVLGAPAIRAFVRSMESEGGTKAMISASLSSARAMAIQKNSPTGIRFQNRYQPDGKGCQYMIFIYLEEDPTKMGNLTIGFRAVEGIEPIKLPDSVGVMDLRLGSTDQIIDDDSKINEDWEVADTTSFSIVFSKSGKLIIHPVRVRNRDGKYQPANPTESMDDIFNSLVNITDNKIGMFVQDDYFSGSPPDLGLGQESSRNSFIIYDRNVFGKLNPGSRYSSYLENLANKEVIYINPYTGTIINR